MRIPLFIFIAFLVCFNASAQNGKDVNIEYMLRGYIYAGTAIEDSTALGGFWKSDNNPKQIESGTIKYAEGIILKIDTTKNTTFSEGFNGYKLFLANNSDSILELMASDSRLSIIAEAFVNNSWQAIEYLPSSWCGNSYHNVFLKPGQYWEFAIPKYNGKIKTKIRYRLQITKDMYVYSNEIHAGINKKQLVEKQGHTPKGIMDPYNE